jgi:hypothetical protein
MGRSASACFQISKNFSYDGGADHAPHPGGARARCRQAQRERTLREDLGEYVLEYGTDPASFCASPSSAPADDVRFLVLSITHEPVLPAAVSREALGAAASTPGARGRLSYVFYARVLEATQRYAADLETVLAMTMAHELGHMLRPTREHDSDGLMRETWTPREFALASRGALAFSKDSAAAIRLALRR